MGGVEAVVLSVLGSLFGGAVTVFGGAWKLRQHLDSHFNGIREEIHLLTTDRRVEQVRVEAEISRLRAEIEGVVQRTDWKFASLARDVGDIQSFLQRKEDYTIRRSSAASAAQEKE
jgi:hypothetical protein